MHEYVAFETIAYRLARSTGWSVMDFVGGMEAFLAEMNAKNASVIEARSVTHGMCRADLVSAGARLSIDTDQWLVARGWTWDELIGAWRSPEEAIAEFPGSPVTVDAIEVRFAATEVGWQPVTMAAGGRSIGFWASELYDPFPTIIQWLETIVEGGEGRVVADLEGTYLELFALPVEDAQLVRIVGAIVPGLEGRWRDVDLDITIARDAFAGSFYSAFRSHVESDRYVADNWAALPMRDDLLRRGIDLSAAEMALLDRPTLSALLARLYPEYLVSFPSAGSEREEFRLFVEAVKTGVTPPDIERTEVAKFIVPAEYETWDAARRVEFASEVLEESVTSWHGWDLRSLRSSRLEGLRVPPCRT